MKIFTKILTERFAASTEISFEYHNVNNSMSVNKYVYDMVFFLKKVSKD